MDLHFTYIPHFGRPLYYPTSKAAQAIVRLSGMRRLSRKSIEALSEAGFTIIITQPG